MVLQELEDRLYTSTEVANILGVSLRSVYRYLEDGKLKAEMKTATGRHRFTKQNILDFLSPQPDRVVAKEPKAEVKEPVAPAPAPTPAPVPAPVVEEAKPEVEAPPVEEKKEDVDWLSKFRQAAEKYKTDQEEETVPATAPEAVSGLAEVSTEEAKPEETPAEVSAVNYYKSAVGGLKEIAQNIDKSAKKASLEYAFTMDAGLSLHKPINPFSLIHTYVRSEDLAFFEKILDLTPAQIGDAQLCLIVSDDTDVYSNKQEVHGLNVVPNEKLKADLMEAGKDELAAEL